ncbi:MAG: enoyl-CoA hydratase/isomerase family protein [Candidatus Hydrogenedentes bacterium]|nr:enoyl-CoA hydratase/isomerase family protein [Candidatus Hydrogenedentota bacterium]
MSDLVLLEQDARGVVTISLNRPEKRNAMNIPLLEALCTAVAASNEDPAVRVIVIRGNGAAFCAGLDLEEAMDTDRSHRSADLVRLMLETVYASPKVTIAAVHGAAVAGGAGLMSACDIVVGTLDAKFGYPEVRRGLVAGLVMTFVRRQLQERHARELLLLGEMINGERAHEIGLINRAVPTDLLNAEVERLVDTVLKGAPGAIANTKRFYDGLWHCAAEADFDKARALHVEVRNGGEAQEGFKAFLDKRKPHWDPSS